MSSKFLTSAKSATSFTTGSVEIDVASVSATNLYQNLPLRSFNGEIINGYIKTAEIEDLGSAGYITESSSDTFTNKSINALTNVISNIGDAEIKTGAAINATKIANGLVSNTEFEYLDGQDQKVNTLSDVKFNSLDVNQVNISGTSIYADTNLVLGTALQEVKLGKNGTTADSVVNKAYVDAFVSGVRFREECRVMATTLPAYIPAGAGVGKTLTQDTPYDALTVDGILLNVNDRVLVNLTGGSIDNGIYVLTQQGVLTTTPWILTRAADADNSPSNEMISGTCALIGEGVSNAGNGYILCTSGFESADIDVKVNMWCLFITAGAGVINHSGLTGLTNDDHPQYVNKNGRAGGQVVYGGTAASEDLTLNSTAHATKGSIVCNDDLEVKNVFNPVANYNVINTIFSDTYANTLRLVHTGISGFNFSVSANRVYKSDYQYNGNIGQVIAYDKHTGAILETIPSPDSPYAGEFGYNMVCNEDYLYIVQRDNAISQNLVYKYSIDKNNNDARALLYIYSFTSSGTNFGGAMAIDKNGNAVVEAADKGKFIVLYYTGVFYESAELTPSVGILGGGTPVHMINNNTGWTAAFIQSDYSVSIVGNQVLDNVSYTTQTIPFDYTLSIGSDYSGQYVYINTFLISEGFQSLKRYSLTYPTSLSFINQIAVGGAIYTADVDYIVGHDSFSFYRWNLDLTNPVNIPLEAGDETLTGVLNLIYNDNKQFYFMNGFFEIVGYEIPDAMIDFKGTDLYIDNIHGNNNLIKLKNNLNTENLITTKSLDITDKVIHDVNTISGYTWPYRWTSDDFNFNIVSASSSQGIYEPYKAVDFHDDTYWESNIEYSNGVYTGGASTAGINGEYITVKLANSIVAKYLLINFEETLPIEFSIFTSLIGITWILDKTINNSSYINYSNKTYIIKLNNSFNRAYYRVVFTTLKPGNSTIKVKHIAFLENLVNSNSLNTVSPNINIGAGAGKQGLNNVFMGYNVLNTINDGIDGIVGIGKDIITPINTCTNSTMVGSTLTVPSSNSSIYGSAINYNAGSSSTKMASLGYNHAITSGSNIDRILTLGNDLTINNNNDLINASFIGNNITLTGTPELFHTTLSGNVININSASNCNLLSLYGSSITTTTQFLTSAVLMGNSLTTSGVSGLQMVMVGSGNNLTGATDCKNLTIFGSTINTSSTTLTESVLLGNKITINAITNSNKMAIVGNNISTAGNTGSLTGLTCLGNSISFTGTPSSLAGTTVIGNALTIADTGDLSNRLYMKTIRQDTEGKRIKYNTTSREVIYDVFRYANINQTAINPVITAALQTDLITPWTVLGGTTTGAFFSFSVNIGTQVQTSTDYYIQITYGGLYRITYSINHTTTDDPATYRFAISTDDSAFYTMEALNERNKDRAETISMNSIQTLIAGAKVRLKVQANVAAKTLILHNTIITLERVEAI